MSSVNIQTIGHSTLVSQSRTGMIIGVIFGLISVILVICYFSITTTNDVIDKEESGEAKKQPGFLVAAGVTFVIGSIGLGVGYIKKKDIGDVAMEQAAGQSTLDNQAYRMKRAKEDAIMEGAEGIASSIAFANRR
jgi:hypothetical protein